MESGKLQADKRDAKGTGQARRLRKQGKLPAIVYGHKQEPEPVAVPSREVELLLEHGTHVVELNLNGSGQQVLIQDVQYNHLGDEIVHIDFMRVDLTERVTVSVPLKFKGTPIGVTEGGLIDYEQVDLEVECAVSDIPGEIVVNIKDLKINEVIQLRDLVLPANVDAVLPEDTHICSVRPKPTEEEVEVAEEGEEELAQPEIIGQEDKDDEEQGEDD